MMSSLTLLGTTATTNIVYDLRLGPNNIALPAVSGKNFAQTLTIVNNCTNLLTVTATSTGFFLLIQIQDQRL